MSAEALEALKNSFYMSVLVFQIELEFGRIVCFELRGKRPEYRVK